MFGFVKSMIADDFNHFFFITQKTFISKTFGFAILKSLYCIIYVNVNVNVIHYICQCHPPPLHILSCISRFLLVNLGKFGAGMLIMCCILPSKNIKSAKSQRELTVHPQTL